jgi:hypothetical protein
MASDPAARRRLVRKKKGLHLTMKAFYFGACTGAFRESFAATRRRLCGQ